jgi:hypothetical protein
MSLTNVSKRIWTLCLKRYVPRYQTVAITKAASTLPSNSFNVHGVANNVGRANVHGTPRHRSFTEESTFCLADGACRLRTAMMQVEAAPRLKTDFE